jgi:AraC-like DNA-binding protein
VILGPDAPEPAMLQAAPEDELGAVLSACEELWRIEEPDAVLRRAVELARERIGLVRAAIFLCDEQAGQMLGTWGMDLEGRAVDEHHVMYALGENDREVFRRAALEGIHYTAFENCPIVVQLENETKVVGRGWVACTPIRSARKNLGMLFNDAALTDAPLDEACQARAAILCSVLGTLLDHAYGRAPKQTLDSRPPPNNALVQAVLRRLATDPTLTAGELSPDLGISPSRLARVFKEEMGMSLVDYRNRLRLERFEVLVDKGGENLLQAALAAGFGSYAQFHRVYRELRGATPRKILKTRRPRR